MAQLEVKPALTTTTDVFETGKFTVKQLPVEKSDVSSPPRPLLIFTPTEEGEYPVLLFLHGFCLSNSSYSELLTHIVSHGFISVAPQLYSLLMPPCNCNTDINSAAEVTKWLSEGLPSVLPENVKGNLLKLALVRHSRGGKSAFCLAMGYGEKSLSFSVLVGIDPVAGTSLGEVDPKIFTNDPFNIEIPVLVVGTGLGDQKKFGLCCPCAPNGLNHKKFYECCQSPCYHLVTTDYGHVDMLDDKDWMPGLICKTGSGSRDPMRRCVGGVVVAFLRAYLESESGDLKAILDEPAIAPVKLDPVEYIEA